MAISDQFLIGLAIQGVVALCTVVAAWSVAGYRLNSLEKALEQTRASQSTSWSKIDTLRAEMSDKYVRLAEVEKLEKRILDQITRLEGKLDAVLGLHMQRIGNSE